MDALMHVLPDRVIYSGECLPGGQVLKARSPCSPFDGLHEFLFHPFFRVQVLQTVQETNLWQQGPLCHQQLANGIGLGELCCALPCALVEFGPK